MLYSKAYWAQYRELVQSHFRLARMTNEVEDVHLSPKRQSYIMAPRLKTQLMSKTQLSCSNEYWTPLHSAILCVVMPHERHGFPPPSSPCLMQNYIHPFLTLGKVGCTHETLTQTEAKWVLNVANKCVCFADVKMKRQLWERTNSNFLSPSLSQCFSHTLSFSFSHFLCLSISTRKSASLLLPETHS